MTEVSFEDTDAQAPASAPGNAGDFFSGGDPSCKFDAIGTVHQGTVLAMEKAQQRNITTGEPKFWHDGNPAEMLVITIQTKERDPNIEDDSGRRRLYVNKPGGMFSALKKALGQEKLVIGGVIAIKYVGNGKPTQKGFSPPKEYVAKYVPPGGSIPQSPNGNGRQPAPQPYPRTRESLAPDATTLATQLRNELPESGEIDPDSVPF